MFIVSHKLPHSLHSNRSLVWRKWRDVLAEKNFFHGCLSIQEGIFLYRETFFLKNQFCFVFQNLRRKKWFALDVLLTSWRQQWNSVSKKAINVVYGSIMLKFFLVAHLTYENQWVKLRNKKNIFGFFGTP